MGNGSGDKRTRGQGDKEKGRGGKCRDKEIWIFRLLVSHSPCPLVSRSLFPFLITGYIWSYQNSRSFFRAIKSQTGLRGWIMKNRRLTLAVVIVFAALMIGAPRWAPSSSAAVDCGLRIADCRLKDGSHSGNPRSAVKESAIRNPQSAIKHWAFIAPARAALPQVKNGSWVKTPIDRFILARLEKEGLTPQPEVDRVTLLRRLSLDLIGLPPTVAEVDAFLNDKSPNAYEKQVERLLASPHYGERWGRHWLDAARYADSDGFEKDKQRSVWFYRDWVINALNADKPYDQFVIEQIAGDLLPGATQDQ